MFVDDGAIIATGATYRMAASCAAQRFEEVTEWLRRCGLRSDPDKSEFITFNPRHSQAKFGEVVRRLGVRDASNGELMLSAVPSVRYLGIYLTQKLSWDVHVKTMCCRARSTMRALHILGNSVRGLDFANWRKVFNAIIIPILTYGSPVWFTDRAGQSKLIQMMQVAQNDAVRRIAGCFRTTPTVTLHYLLAIPPIKFTLRKLRGSFQDRLSRFPPTHLLRQVVSNNTAACWPSFINPPTTLTALSPVDTPRFYPPRHPQLPQRWSHPRVRSFISEAPTAAHRAFVRSALAKPPVDYYTPPY